MPLKFNSDIMAAIIGRELEQSELLERYASGSAEFVAVYGRRRVGKTFLIRETLKDKLTFYHTSLSIYDEDKPVTTQDQLKHFYHSLLVANADIDHCPKDWFEAMYMLEDFLKNIDDGDRQVVFIDELPWLDTPRSQFLVALEAFWNGWGASRDNLMLIVCGSASSWMLNNLINNKGGLYGRLTWDIKLSPFTLHETELFFQAKGINMSRYDIVQAYMVFGGIPYYLNYFQKGLSLAQNIDLLLFDKKAKLQNEFKRLFHALYKYPDNYIEVVKLLSSRHSGFSRDEIVNHLALSTGGTLSQILLALEDSDFILRYRPFDARKNETLYKLIDPFCRAYLYFKGKKHTTDDKFWQHNIQTNAMNSWCGIAFEEICLMHIEQIKKALGIESIHTEESAYTLRGDEKHDGMQCDLLIRRADRIINLCEMKFCQEEFVIDKNYDLSLRNRIGNLRDRIKKTETVHLTFITTFGVKGNMYNSVVQSEVTIDDLFVAPRKPKKTQ